MVSAPGRLRRRARLEHRTVHGSGRVLPGVRQLRRQHHRARGHARGGHGDASESRRGADRSAARAARPRPDQQRDGHHPRHRRDRRPGLASADPVPDADLALHRRQRARLRVGRGAPLHLGRGRRQRRQDAGDELLSAVGRAAVEGRDAVRQDGHRVLLQAVGSLPLPCREQRERDRGRDGVSDDRLLPQSHRRARRSTA